METIEGQQISYEEDEPSAMANAGAYGFNPMTFADQDDYLDKFGYNDGGGRDFIFYRNSLFCIGMIDVLDGRDSPDVNHWNSINSGGDMDIDR